MPYPWGSPKVYERVAFELLLLYRGGTLTEEDERAARKLEKIIEYIVEINGPLHIVERKMLFLKCIMEEMGYQLNIAVFNIGKIMKYWQACSEYCHKALIANETWENPAYVEAAYKRMNEVKSFLLGILNGNNRANITITDPDVQALEKDFLDRKIDEASLRTRTKLMMPVLRQRMMAKKEK